MSKIEGGEREREGERERDREREGGRGREIRLFPPRFSTVWGQWSSAGGRGGGSAYQHGVCIYVLYIYTHIDLGICVISVYGCSSSCRCVQQIEASGPHRHKLGAVKYQRISRLGGCPDAPYQIRLKTAVCWPGKGAFWGLPLSLLWVWMFADFLTLRRLGSLRICRFQCVFCLRDWMRGAVHKVHTFLEVALER